MILEKFSLKERVGIVTGGGRGLGKVFCRSFADVGADIVIAEVDTGTGPQTASEIEAMGRRSLFVETNPIPVKTALSLMGKCRADLRLPLVPMSEGALKKLRGAMSDFGLI